MNSTNYISGNQRTVHYWKEDGESKRKSIRNFSRVHREEEEVSKTSTVALVLMLCVIIICVVGLIWKLTERNACYNEYMSAKAANQELREQIASYESLIEVEIQKADITREAKEKYNMINGDTLSGVTVYVSGRESGVVYSASKK